METYLLDAATVFFQYFSAAVFAVVIVFGALSFLVVTGKKYNVDEEVVDYLDSYKAHWKPTLAVLVFISIVLTFSSSQLQFKREIDVEAERDKQMQEYQAEKEVKKKKIIRDLSRQPRWDEEERDQEFEDNIRSWKKEGE